MSQYFVLNCNFATKIQIIFETETAFIVHFRNYDTFLCIFKYKIDAEIAN